MSEWRRARRSWPEERPADADATSLPEALRTRIADDGPWMREAAVAALLGLGPVLLGALLKPWIGSAGAAALACLGIAAFLLGHRRAVRALGGRWAARRREADLDALRERGEPTLDGEFVGVAYADRLWIYPGRGDADLDAGVVRLDFDRLSFAGRTTRFELPVGAIVGTEVRRHARLGDERARIYVHWREGGEAGTLSLGLPPGPLHRHARDTAALRERIETWRTEPFPRRVSTGVLPPRVEPRAAVSGIPSVGLRAKALAAVATALLLVVVESGMTLLSIRMGWRRTGRGLMSLLVLSPMVWAFLAAWIDRRRPERD